MYLARLGVVNSYHHFCLQIKGSILLAPLTPSSAQSYKPLSTLILCCIHNVTMPFTCRIVVIVWMEVYLKIPNVDWEIDTLGHSHIMCTINIDRGSQL
jgi:hypothetical protein